MIGWQPIKTAPLNCKVIVHYRNILDKDRTVFAVYAERGKIAITEDSDDTEVIDGQDFLPEGWWEIVESPVVDFCFVRLGGNPAFWMPIPEAPEYD